MVNAAMSLLHDVCLARGVTYCGIKTDDEPPEDWDTIDCSVCLLVDKDTPPDVCPFGGVCRCC